LVISSFLVAVLSRAVLQGFCKAIANNPKTSRKLPPSGADQVTYANADGTKTSFT
jgi:hypothetical protein